MITPAAKSSMLRKTKYNEGLQDMDQGAYVKKGGGNT